MDVSGAGVTALAAMLTIWMGDGPTPDGPAPGPGGDALVHSTPAEPSVCDATDGARDSDEPRRARPAPEARDLDPARNVHAAAEALRAYAPLLDTGNREGADAADGGHWAQHVDEALGHVESDDDLFAAIVDLLEPLGVQGFVFVRTTDGRSWRRGEAQPGLSPETPSEPSAAIIDTYLSGDGVDPNRIGNGPQVVIGRLRDGTVYARPSRPTTGGRASGPVAGLGVLLQGLARGEAIVVDLRSGGADLGAAPWNLASLLIDEPARRPRLERFDPAGGAFTVAADAEILPDAARPTGPVILLTGGATRGESEALVLAAMPSLRVTRIGDATSGRLSRATVVELPNGWRIGLPSQRLVAGNGDSFDGRGVPPHIAAPASPGDAARGRDAALDAALAYLDRLRRSGLLPEREPAAATALD